MPSPDLDNPLGMTPQTVAEGKDLYLEMNCDGCHGASGGGGMGPNLKDVYWRYGGTPADVYNTLYEGRSNGMPAWNAALPPDSIWKIVAYVQSFGGTIPPDKAEEALAGTYQGTVATKSSASLIVGGYPIEGE